MNNKNTKYFQIFYADIDTDIIDHIISEVDGMYERIINIFELELSSVIFDFYLCPDVESYKSYAMVSDEYYHTWMVGNTDYINNRICILSPHAVTDRSYEDMIKVIKHEIIHIAFDALASPDKVSICISEGVAVAFAEQIYIPCLDINNYPRYIDLLDEEYFYKNNGYSYSGCYILYLLKRYGKDTFKNIYSGKEDIAKYLFDGFEREAIAEIISDR